MIRSRYIGRRKKGCVRTEQCFSFLAFLFFFFFSFFFSRRKDRKSLCVCVCVSKCEIIQVRELKCRALLDPTVLPSTFSSRYLIPRHSPRQCKHLEKISDAIGISFEPLHHPMSLLHWLMKSSSIRRHSSAAMFNLFLKNLRKILSYLLPSS